MRRGPSPCSRPHHACERRRNGWYPAVLGPGNLAAKGRVPYAILALVDTLRLFPGQARKGRLARLLPLSVDRRGKGGRETRGSAAV